MDIRSLALGMTRLEEFSRRHPDFDILTFDFFDARETGRLGLETAEGVELKSSLMACQRLARLAPSASVVTALQRLGFESAAQIAGLDESCFVDAVASALSGDAALARGIHERARMVKGQAIHLWANAVGLARSPLVSRSPVSSVGETIDSFFSGLPSYEALFGNQDYCSCEHCRSIFGPAAYFVDLMRITQRYVTEPNQATIPPGMTLEDRREKLFTMPLTCAATNDIVPHLQIANEVLSVQAAKELDTDDPERVLATATYPFNLPQNLPLAQIRFSLEAAGLALAQIYNVYRKAPFTCPVTAATTNTLTLAEDPPAAAVAMGSVLWIVAGAGLGQARRISTYDAATRTATVGQPWAEVPGAETTCRIDPDDWPTARESLGLSIEQASLVATRVVDPAALKRLYGLPDQATLDDLADVPVFLQQTGLDPTRLLMLLYDDLDEAERGAGLAHGFFINRALEDGAYIAVAPQTDGPDRLTHIDEGTLDRIDRFVRLAQWTALPFTDLDWLLTALDEAEIGTGTLIELAGALRAKQVIGLPIDALTALWSEMKTIGRGDGAEPVDLFDRVWNARGVRGDGGIYRPLYPANPLFQDSVVEWTVAGRETAAGGFGRTRLMAALGVSDTVLTDIGALLFGKDATVPLDVGNLTLLYRTAILLKLTRQSVADYGRLLGWVGLAPTEPFVPENAVRLVATARWLDAMHLSVAELAFVLDGVVPTRPPAAARTAAYAQMRTLWQLARPQYLTPLSFVADIVTEEQSAAAYEAVRAQSQPALIRSLAADYVAVFGGASSELALVLEEVTAADLSFLATEPGFSDAQIDVVAAAMNAVSAAQQQFLNEQLAAAFNAEGDLIEAVAAYFGAVRSPSLWLTTLLVPVAETLAGTMNPAWIAVQALFVEISRLLVAAVSLPISPPVLQGMVEMPLAFGIADLGEPTLADLQAVAGFNDFVATFGDREAGFLEFLAMPSATPAEAEIKLGRLAGLTGWPLVQIHEILAQIGETAALVDTVPGLVRLKQVFDLLAVGGFDPAFAANFLALRLLPADGPGTDHTYWQTYRDTAAATLGVIAAKLGTVGWAAAYARITERMNEARRDALEGIVLWELGLKDRRQLYGFLLIDVDMSGCATTSYVAEAIGAVQLYLQRCRLNLELGIDRLNIPQVWWEWMTNYRVWEANRKIFLYPENYMEPTLRSSRTDLFKELQEALLQTNITDQTVSRAYGNYFLGLEQLTTLIYADSLRCIVDDGIRGPVDTLFVFARTRDEPYQFYFARQEMGAVWSQWQKIGASIPSPHVTPVYAFGRLFLFWVDLKVVRETRIRAESGAASVSENSSTFTAAIRYAFQTSTGEWTAAQTLFQEAVAYVAPSKRSFDNNSGYSLFDMDALFWRKCNALAIAPDRLLAPPLATGTDQKILILYGPFIENDQIAPNPLVQPPHPDPALAAQEPSLYAFELNVYNRIGMVNQAIATSTRGDIPLQKARVLNRDLNLDFLMRQSEFQVLVQNISAGVPPALRPIIDVPTNALHVGDTLNVLRTNYYGDWTPAISTAAAARPVAETDFVLAGLDEAGSTVVYDDLKGHGIVDDNGVIDSTFTTNTNLDFLFPDEPARTRAILIAEIQHILLDLKARGLPATKSSFLLTEIDAALAGQVWLDLIGNGVIETNGRVDPSFNSRTDLSFLFDGAGEEEKARLIYEVRRVLLAHLAEPLLLGAISRENSATIMVKNQPDWFLINTGNEAFKVGAAEGAMPMLSQQLRVKETASTQTVTETSFITPNIDVDRSKQAYADLLGNGVINAKGQVDPSFGPHYNLSFLFDNAPPRERALMTAEVRTILLDLPTITALSYFFEDNDTVVTATSFVSLGIGPQRSKEAFDALVAHSVVSPDGTISRSYGPQTDLSYLYPEAGQGRDLLIAETRVILDRYFSATWLRTIHDLSFRFARMTTAAVARLNAALTAGGIEKLLSLPSQQAPVVPLVPFSSYLPTPRVIEPPLFDGGQVDFDGPYGLYYWELFFFTPELVASSLAKNGRYDAALKWLQYIFDPTVRPDPLTPADFVTPDIDEAQATGAYEALQEQGIITADGAVAPDFGPATDLSFLFPGVTEPATRQRMIREVRNVLMNHCLATPSSRFWQFMPFRNQTLQSLTEILTDPVTIAIYNNDPFDPYAIARLRIGAFEKATVMSYVDALIRWGDTLFAQKTREALTAATMLYLYADELLGPRPVEEGPCRTQPPASFNEIAARYRDVPGGIPQFLIDMENVVPMTGGAAATGLLGQPFNDVEALFCVPDNDRLLATWDLVADRLYKLRNCLDLDGNPLHLPLFAPPLDPMALVRAAAAGGSGLAVSPQAQAGVPIYRYSTLMLQARTIVSSATILGSALMNALMERDNEVLFRLRAAQESAILNLTVRMKTLQIEEATQALAALQQSKAALESRRDFYKGLVDEFMSPAEIAHITLSSAALISNIAGGIAETVAAIAYAAPQVGAPTAMTYGGIQLGNSASKWAAAFNSITKGFEYGAQTSLTVAGYQRRAQDWQREVDQSAFDLAQTEKQILGAQAQLDMARRDLEIHQQTIAQAQEYADFLLRKFDSYELFAWMAGRLSTLFYQTYRMALEATLAAQGAYQYELNSDDVFVNFSPWDEAHNGLLAGETLNMALDQMDQAYSRNNKRRLEITKTVSLAQLAPAELLRLRGEGTCTIKLDEALFDFDFPGHYCRRIKTVEFSLVSSLDEGSGFEIHATILQTQNDILLRPDPEGLEYLIDGGEEPPPSVRRNWQSNQVIADSMSYEGSGLWELILGIDDRLYPFEGTGAVSTFTVSMPPATNRFDFATISDVQVKIRYSALDGGKPLRRTAEQLLSGPRFAGHAFLSLATDFSKAWEDFMADHSDPDKQVLRVEIGRAELAPNLRGYVLDTADVWITVPEWQPLPKTSQFLTLAAAKLEPAAVTLVSAVGLYDAGEAPLDQFAGEWTITVDLAAMRKVPELAALLIDGFLDPDKFLDIGLAPNYRAVAFGA